MSMSRMKVEDGMEHFCQHFQLAGKCGSLGDDGAANRLSELIAGARMKNFFIFSRGCFWLILSMVPLLGMSEYTYLYFCTEFFQVFGNNLICFPHVK